LVIDAHRETRPIRSRRFRAFLLRNYYREPVRLQCVDHPRKCGACDNRYMVDSTVDVVTEAANEGTDTRVRLTYHEARHAPRDSAGATPGAVSTAPFPRNG